MSSLLSYPSHALRLFASVVQLDWRVARAISTSRISGDTNGSRLPPSAAIWRMGHVALCPHANTAHFDTFFPDIPDEAYLSSDLLLLERCDGLVLVPGLHPPGQQVDGLRLVAGGAELGHDVEPPGIWHGLDRSAARRHADRPDQSRRNFLRRKSCRIWTTRMSIPLNWDSK